MPQMASPKGTTFEYVPVYEKVFSVPELFEAILLKLPIRDLLVNAQRVNRSWNNTIESSPNIQKALFFQPVPFQVQPEPEYNPLLKSAFSGWFIPEHRHFGYDSADMFKSLPWNEDDRSRSAYSRKDASWRNMLPAHPMVQTLEVMKERSYMCGNDLERGVVTFEDGVRMGTLYDLAQQEVSRAITNFHMSFYFSREDTPHEETCSLECPDARKTDAPWPKITMNINYTHQCSGGFETISRVFKSEGFAKLDLKLEDWVVRSEDRLPYPPRDTSLDSQFEEWSQIRPGPLVDTSGE